MHVGCEKRGREKIEMWGRLQNEANLIRADQSLK